jgi:hypothetical protein
MSITPEEVKRAIALDSGWRDQLRGQWLRLMELAVWGDLKGANPSAGGRVRKRVLEVGEKLRSLFNDRGWIPQPREQLKNLLGSCLSLRDSVAALEKAAQDMDSGVDHPEFQRLIAGFEQTLAGPLRERENAWATLLERVNQQARDEDGD